MDFTLELVVVPVSDVDRAKAFYSERCGFHVDVDHTAGDDFRVVQLTPPGSACSISIGKGLAKMEPGTLQGLQLCVTDIDAARQQLADAGVDITPGPPHRRRRVAGRPRRAVELVRVLQRPGRQRLGRPGEARGELTRAFPNPLLSAPASASPAGTGASACPRGGDRLP